MRTAWCGMHGALGCARQRSAAAACRLGPSRGVDGPGSRMPQRSASAAGARQGRHAPIAGHGWLIGARRARVRPGHQRSWDVPYRACDVPASVGAVRPAGAVRLACVAGGRLPSQACRPAHPTLPPLQRPPGHSGRVWLASSAVFLPHFRCSQRHCRCSHLIHHFGRGRGMFGPHAALRAARGVVDKTRSPAASRTTFAEPGHWSLVTGLKNGPLPGPHHRSSGPAGPGRWCGGVALHAFTGPALHQLVLCSARRPIVEWRPCSLSDHLACACRAPPLSLPLLWSERGREHRDVRRGRLPCQLCSAQRPPAYR